jgi:hypothetical protein
MRNHRNFSRIPLVGFVDIKMVGKNMHYSGFIEQISRGGIGVYTKEKIRPGSRVVLELLCFVRNDTLSSSISGTVTSCGGIVSYLKKYNELGVVAIKFDKEVNSFDHRPLHNCFIEYDAKQKQKRRSLLRLI